MVNFADHEKQPVRWSVLDTCSGAFEVAYLRHLASQHEKFVTVVGPAELIYLTETKQPYDLILGRPHVSKYPNAGIEFWLTRVQNTRSTGPFLDYPELVALDYDAQQFYEQRRETDVPSPIGVDQSRELISYIHMAEIISIK